MAIKFSWQKLPVDENGKAYNSLDDFKIAMLDRVLSLSALADNHTSSVILEHRDEVIEILTLTTDARPSARGQKRPRKSKPAELPNVEPKAA